MKTIIQPIFLLLCIHLVFIAPSCNDNKTNNAETEHKDHDVYTCPMHPEIIRNVPGACPICGMDLVKKQTGSQAVKDVQLEALLKPANAFVVSTVPLTTIEQREEDIELNVTGSVAYDTRQAGTVSSRLNGRIERLYIRYKYQPVRKGQKIMDIYSPELMTAQQNLIFLLNNDRDNATMINAAKERLRLLGMSASQVSQVVNTKTPKYSVPVFSNYSGFVTDINNTNAPGPSPGKMQDLPSTNTELNVREGMYVQAGQAVFTVYNPSHAWILLDIFPGQQAMVQVGNAVRIVPETAPQSNFRSQISYIEPIFRQGAKTATARVYFNNSQLQLPIGSRVTANIFARPKTAWWLPREAVLSLGRDNIVFMKEAGGFRAHKIITGNEVNRHIHVIAGLEKQDSVAVNAQFLIDNETFIKVNEQ